MAENAARVVTFLLPPAAAVLLDETDWSVLDHAYGPAVGYPLPPYSSEDPIPDLPDLLRQLSASDPAVRADTLGHVCALAFHQSSFYGVSAVVGRYLAAILDDPRSGESDGAQPSLRVKIIHCLRDFAEDAAWGEHDSPGYSYPELEAFRVIRPELYAAVARYLDDPDAETRDAARAARVPLLETPTLADERNAATVELRGVLADATDRHERATAVLTIGVAWRQDTSACLKDSDPAIRALAALAPACAENPDATRVLLAALANPVAADGWFVRPLPKIRHRYVAGTLFEAAVERTASIDELLPAAVAVLPHLQGQVSFGDYGVGGASRLLSLVPEGVPEHEHELTPDQDAVLTALAASSLWVWGPSRETLPRIKAEDLPHMLNDVHLNEHLDRRSTHPRPGGYSPEPPWLS
ncbi:hypothetical protein [Yinghuangia sp. YIM S10712]|uniref:hypothetical protein n=1 Tax=Yinghuangia sp. YIM S10712 TaxID=3436930 RepID=UPI003F53E2BD